MYQHSHSYAVWPTISQPGSSSYVTAPTANGRHLTDNQLAESGPAEAVRIPLDLVDANPNNPRGALTEIGELADNVRTFGLLQPITVRRAGARYELLAGHRRRAAFLILREQHPADVQWRTIPAVVRSADDDESYLMLLSAQIHSKQWRPREEAAALERLAETRTLRDVGALVNRSEGWVSKRLRVYADSVLSGYVQSGKLPTSVAEELLQVSDVALRRDMADQAAAAGWSKDQARGAVRRLRIDAQLRDLGRRVTEMLAILSAIEPRAIPIETARDLAVLRGRIDVMARGGPMLPTIAEAERKAGIKQRDRNERKRPGYKPKL
jgi:ParB family chromosome partitioning protein